MSDLSYIDENGNTVFTSHYLRVRRTCCKTNCLHCPYGTTIKKLGIQFQDFEPEKTELATAILQSFNKSFKDIEHQEHGNIKFMLIKEKVIGLFVKNHIIIKEFYLTERFRDQDISKELVESYFF